MTPYNPREWTSHLFDIEGSLVREILGRVVVTVVWSAVVVCLFYYGPGWIHYSLQIPLTAHSLVGTALGLLLVFRTNSSYDRFWEGRKFWGSIVNECRNLARQSSVWLAADPVVAREMIDWTIAFPFATKQRLRGEPGIGVSLPGLSHADIQKVESSENLPLAISRAMTLQLLASRERGLIDSLQLTALDHNVQLLIDYYGGCDRIKVTPMPFAYTVHLRWILIVYCLTLPMALVHDFGWATIPTILLVSYALFGIEEIGVEIEDPFGLSKNDLPIHTICEGIQSTLNEIRESSVTMTC